MWQRILRGFGGSSRRSRRDRVGAATQRRLRLEQVEKRQLLATDLASITGVAFVDLENDGSSVSNPPILVDGSNNLVAPGTAGATGVTIELFRDDGPTPGVFDPDDPSDPTDLSDTLVGTQTTDSVTGIYRFDGLTAGNFFVRQAAVNGLVVPSNTAPILVNVTEADGVQTVQIDDFSDTVEIAFDATPASPTETQFQSGLTGTIGGERDVELINTNTTGQFSFFLGANSGQVSIGSNGGATGTALIQYDGTDGSIALDATGLGGVSLGGGAAAEPLAGGGGLIVNAQTQLAGDELVIEVFSSATDSSTTTIPLPDSGSFEEIFVPFSAFAPNLGAGANFNDVGAIEATVNLDTVLNDVDISIIEARSTDVFVQDLPAIQPLTLGGRLFLDVSPTGSNNGTREGDEGNFTDPVVVELFDVTGATGVFDPTAQPATATVTTSILGTYEFTDLDPGDYRVVIPASQFVDNSANASPNGVLFGHASSLFTDAAPDPDDDVDDDDNGAQPVAGGAIISEPITLVSQSEPTDDDDTDFNTNTTLDFGLLPQIDLQITKTLNGASTIVPGGTAVFDITVQNLGPLDATGVVATDTLPAGLTFDPGANDGALTVNGNAISLAIGALAADGSTSFQIIAGIDPAQTADLVNPATVTTTDQVDLDPTNNDSSADVDFSSTDLRITKTASPDPVNAGDQLTYTITVVNDGPDDAVGVFVTDVLPPETTFVSGSVALPGVTGDNSNLIVQDPNSTGNDNELQINIGGLANTDTAVITLIVDVDSDSPDLFTNAARVNVDPDTDPNEDNDTDSVDSDVVREVDLEIVKTATGTPIAGGDMTFSITVSNNGPSVARGVTVNDLLPDNVTFAGNLQTTDGVTVVQTDDPSDTDTDDGDNLTFTLPDIGTDAGDAVTFSFDVTLAQDIADTFTNTATVDTTDTDTEATNDSDDALVNVDRVFDLTIAKTVDLATAVPGSATPLVYTITVTNAGTSISDVPDVVVTDTLPAGVTGVSAVALGATDETVDFANGIVTITFASLAVGESQTITIDATVNPDATGTITNPAVVSTTTAGETDTTNNDAEAVTTLTPDFDVVVTKTVDATTFGPGDTVTYTVNLENEGPSVAAGVILSDVVPTGLTFVSGTLDGQAGTETGGTVTFPSIDISSGANLDATLTFTVDAATDGTITNVASIPDDLAGENDITNNSSSVDITVEPQADLAVTKTVSAASAQVGTDLTYTIVVTNNGPSAAESVTLADTLPAGVTFVSGSGPGGVALNDDDADGLITFDAGTLASAASFTLTIVASIDAGASGDQTNTATVATTTTDDVTANNTATATTAVDPVTSTIAGTVFADADGDGIQDAGEAGIAGVTLVLTGTDTLGASVTQTVTTDANGDYVFTALPAGTYSITETQPDGFNDGTETVGTGATGAVAGDDVFTEIGLGTDSDAIEFNFAEVEIIELLSKRRFLSSS